MSLSTGRAACWRERARLWPWYAHRLVRGGRVAAVAAPVALALGGALIGLDHVLARVSLGRLADLGAHGRRMAAGDHFGALAPSRLDASQVAGLGELAALAGVLALLAFVALLAYMLAGVALACGARLLLALGRTHARGRARLGWGAALAAAACAWTLPRPGASSTT